MQIKCNFYMNYLAFIMFLNMHMYGYSNPDFIIIGAAKSGTTSLYHYLAQHPQILRSIYPTKITESLFNNPNDPIAFMGKEINFFSVFYENGIEWYRNQFPSKKPDLITGEASPNYMYFSNIVSKRIKQHYPNIKLIVILRNPIDAIFSIYKMEVEVFKREERSFENAYQDYLSWYDYVKQLKAYFECFNEHQFHIAIYEEFFLDPEQKLNEIFSFLGVKDYKLFKYDVYWKNDSDLKINIETRKKLQDHFKPLIKELEKMLQRKLPW